MSTRAAPTAASVPVDASVRLAIALAFADASVVVLALPQIVVRLNTSISHVTWVITAYNLALIASTVAIVPLASRLASRRALVVGLGVFGLASLGAGVAGTLPVLVVWRCVQGAGAGLLVCASLPLFARGRQAGTPVLQSWAATAAFGAALGPAVGGILTQLFDWRAIFLAQAPVAAAAALVALAGPDAVPHVLELGPAKVVGAGRSLSPRLANVSLALISAGLIGALFLATVLLINVWQLTPLGAAAVLAVIPIMTAVAERLSPSWPAVNSAAVGAVVLAVGLVLLALIPVRELGVATIALALCGVGLGLAFPSLTRVALRSRGPLVARAAKTVAAREGGLVLGLVLLTPILVNQLNAAPAAAVPPVTGAVISAPIPILSKLGLGADLVKIDSDTPASELPDFTPAFAHAAQGQSADTQAALSVLQAQLRTIVQRAVTRSFRRPLLVCALLSLLALLPLGYSRLQSRRL
jgi:predicted MFS family arabinose efflux permease